MTLNFFEIKKASLVLGLFFAAACNSGPNLIDTTPSGEANFIGGSSTQGDNIENEGIAINENLFVGFNQPLDAASVTSSALFVVIGGSRNQLFGDSEYADRCTPSQSIDADIIINGSEVEIAPSTALTCGQEYFICVTSNIRFSNGAHFRGNVFRFFTAACEEPKTKRPSINIGTPSATLINGSSSVSWTLSYSDATSVNLTAADISFIGTSTCEDISVANGKSMNPEVSVSDCTEGFLNIHIAEGTALSEDDLEALEVSGEDMHKVTVDTTPPEVSISAPSTFLMNGTDSVTWTLTYTGADDILLREQDVSLVGTSTCNDLLLTDGDTVTPQITASNCTEGSLNIQIAAGRAQDAAGNSDAGVSGDAEDEVSVDTTPPSIAISAPSSSLINGDGSVTWTLTYTGASTVNVRNEDVTLTGTSECATVNVSDGNTNTPSVTASDCTEGSLNITIAAGRAEDLAGNPSAGISGAAENDVTVDTSAPSIAISAPSPSAFMASGETVTVTVTYSDADTVNLRDEDISASEDSTSACASFEVQDGTTATPDILAKNCTDGTLKIKVAAGRAWDTAGNSADEIESTAITFLPAPTASIQPPDTCLVGGVLPESISISFSRAVSDVDVADFEFTGEGCAATVANVLMNEDNDEATITVGGDRSAQVACVLTVHKDDITDSDGRTLREDVSYTYDLSPHYYYNLPVGSSYEDLRFGPDCTGWSKITTDQQMEIHSMGFQSNGKIVASGIYNGGQQIAILRMSAGGLLDLTFGDDGVKIHTIEGETSLKITDMAVQSDDKLVLVGYSEDSKNDLILRLTVNGDLDESFSEDGIILGRIPQTEGSRITGVALDNNGNILISGTRETVDSQALYVARFLSDGNLDTSFNEFGAVPGVRVISDAPGVAGSLALDAAGRVLVVGTIDPNTAESEQVVVRLLSDGTFDPTFGDGGFYFNPIDKGSFNRILIDSDRQRIYIGGHEDNPDDNNIHNRINASIHALTEDGALDLTFGQNGTIMGMWGLHNNTNSVQDMKLDHNGRIAAAVSINIDAASNRWNLAATQINPDGTFNSESWGSIRHWQPSAGTNEYTTRLLVDEFNRYIVAGYQNNGTSYPIFLRVTGIPIGE